jgi:lipoprotein-anchoring transpeptidase ErfK/SrfK
MHTPLSIRISRRVPSLARGMLVVLLLSLMLLTSACGGNTQLQQQASQDQEKLASLLHQAQVIGVPSSLLQPIFKQEQELSSTRPPISIFNDQPINDYYSNLITRYSQLQVQVQGVITICTEQAEAQAQHDVQNLQTALSQRRAQGLPVQYFAQQFLQVQTLLATAKYPKDYVAVSNKAGTATQALNLMQAAAHQLSTFKTTIALMGAAHLDVTAMQMLYQNDQQALASATMPLDFQNLSVLIDAQYQLAVVHTTEAIPYITSAKWSALEAQVQQLKTYGMAITAYQKRLNADKVMMNNTKTLHDYQLFARQVDADIASMHDDLVQGEATYLVKQFHQEAAAWGQTHVYHDSFDGKNYPLDGGYLQQGIGDLLDQDLSWSYTPADFQSMVDEVNNELFNLHMLEANYNDKTPYNQVHATDMQMLNHYKLQKGQVLMVSLTEQAMRIYQDGRLVKAFYVTTGRVELPSLPGVWPTLDRKSPTVFKSPDPPGSPYWYPDTPIHYAILYHWGGYNVHDSWWRVDYGPGTQFPHTDSGGDQTFAGNGSHGCINMQEDQAAWVYNHTDWNTTIMVY